MKKLIACLLLLSLGVLNAADEMLIVKDGKPNAQIVVAAEKRPRVVTFAALELQYYIKKMSGASLPIVTKPDAGQPVKIYVGKSPETEKLGVKDDGLDDGAYKMVSGPSWIVLLGADRDFVPPTPWPNKRTDVARAQAEWDALKIPYEYPFRAGFKTFWPSADGIFSKRYGSGNMAVWKNDKVSMEGFSIQDEGGTLNADNAFLRSFGVRWYMPGELGEVVPTMATISVKPLNQTVKPHYKWRNWINYALTDFYEDAIFSWRVGMKNGSPALFGVPHGLFYVTASKEVKKAHPEYYALIKGKRDTEHKGGGGTACFSSEGLVKETANFLRLMFDRYDPPLLDVWPNDGYLACQCDLCKGKGASELVWGFADRVAKEVYKTHPKKLVSCGAYTNYMDAPDTIAKFSPNLVVLVCAGQRALMMDQEYFSYFSGRVEKWKSKVAPGNIARWENHRYYLWGMDKEGNFKPFEYPIICPRGMARELKYTKDFSFGDVGEQSQTRGKWAAPGLDHLNLYVQSQFLWNPDQDVEALLDDYYRNFYGSAAKDMKAAFDFAENNMAVKDRSVSQGRANVGNVSLDTKLRLRELLDKARKTAGDTVYGKRIDKIISELMPREELIAKNKDKETELIKSREKNPVAVGHEGSGLDNASVYKLKINSGQAVPSAETSFKVGWDKDSLLLEITCKEPNMGKLQVSPLINAGDHVAISIDTGKHRYYHIEVNPDGKLLEGSPNPPWNSLAQVKAERGADFWKISLRIPAVNDAYAAMDPNNGFHADKPTAENPWYFNIGRCRRAGLDKPEFQAFSKTDGNWHIPAKFARLEIQLFSLSKNSAWHEPAYFGKLEIK